MAAGNLAGPLTFSNPCDPEVYDLHVTCSDNEMVYAHRQVLMSRCTCALAPAHRFLPRHGVCACGGTWLGMHAHSQ